MLPVRRLKLRWLFLFAVILSPFVLFSGALRPWSHSPVASVFGELTYPFEYLWFQASEGVSGAWNRYIALVDAAEENEELRRELRDLRTKIVDYDHQVQEAGRLRKLLGFREEFRHQAVLAEVVSFSPHYPFQSLRVNLGRSQAIAVGMPVAATQGVVGRVVRVGQFFADIQLLSDPNFNLDVLISRTRIRGVLKGMGENRCRLQLHRRAEVKIGDEITTSGLIGGFPKGLPVGHVVRISYDSENVTQLITIVPWVDYHQLEEVMVLQHFDREVETIIETAGPEWLEETVAKLQGDGR